MALHSSRLSHWWVHVCFLWQTSNKLPWVVLSGLALLIGAFGFLAHSIFVERTDRQQLRCLALNVYYEARGESRSGQLAVAEVTMNRVTSGYFPATVCGVVYEKRWDRLRGRYVGAFSWTELHRRPAPQGKDWEQAWEVAEQVYFGRHEPKLDGVLHYHAVYIKPSWARGKKPTARIGKHLFYKTPAIAKG